MFATLSTDIPSYEAIHGHMPLQYILNNIFICIIKEQCSDQGESQWKH